MPVKIRPSRTSALLAVTLSLALLCAVPTLAQQTVGVFIQDEQAQPGYTFFSPMPSDVTYLIDNGGHVVHSWTNDGSPSLNAYLLENGNLLHMTNVNSQFGSQVTEKTWDGTIVWEWVSNNPQQLIHHDIEPMPNGNVLMVARQVKTGPEALAAGRDPAMLGENTLYPDSIIEVQPTGPNSGIVVWEWSAWDHLIQDFDPTKDNYGVVEDHPELIDLNYDSRLGGRWGTSDWLHVNGVDYNPDLDQITISVFGFSELWVIDHSTTTAEAAGHTGGNSGKGGDLLYRWGNPQAYGRGTADDRVFYFQHDSRWIEPGLPGEGNMTIFNNGRQRPEGDYSTVVEIVTPVDEFGNYSIDPGEPFGPAEPLWRYVAPTPDDFFSQNISGAHRLPNGNTLICDGPNGHLFEVTQEMEIVWDFVSPVDDFGTVPQGDLPLGNSIFRAHRYTADYPGLAGKELVPGAPLEQVPVSPLPVPDGSGGSDPVTVARLDALGDDLRVAWDSTTCAASDYNLFSGSLENLEQMGIDDARCSIGTSGSYDWLGTLPGNLFFLLVGVDPSGIYESSWGTDSSGLERRPFGASQLCGSTMKDATETCP